MMIGYTKRIFWLGKRLFLFLILALPLVTACAIPVREAYQVDTSLSIGSVQGDRFMGQRFPFTIRILAGWQAATQYPEFLAEQGYGLEGCFCRALTDFYLLPHHRRESGCG